MEVIISGTVTSYMLNNRINSLLKTISEVKKINNNLEIAFSTFPSDSITDNIRKV